MERKRIVKRIKRIGESMFNAFRKLDWFVNQYIKRYKVVFIIILNFERNSPLIDKAVLVVSKSEM